MNMTTNQLNPYAIALCTLGRWISARQWVPAGSGSFSIRTSVAQALITPLHKDRAELSPQDLQQLSWPATATATEPVAITHQLHAKIYQQVMQAKVVLQVQSSSALLFSKLVQSSQHQFVGYQLQHVLQQNPHQALTLAIVPDANDLAQLHERLLQQHQLGQSALLVRNLGLIVWAEHPDQARRQLEAWDFLLHCELELLKHQH